MDAILDTASLLLDDCHKPGFLSLWINTISFNFLVTFMDSVVKYTLKNKQDLIICNIQLFEAVGHLEL